MAFQEDTDGEPVLTENVQGNSISSVHSQYTKQKKKNIKTLSQNEIEKLLTKTKTPFKKIAKPTKLNSYPNPRHILDTYDTGEFDLLKEQHKQIEALYDEMRLSAIALGTNIIDIEKAIDDAFTSETITNTP